MEVDIDMVDVGLGSISDHADHPQLFLTVLIMRQIYSLPNKICILSVLHDIDVRQGSISDHADHHHTCVISN